MTRAILILVLCACPAGPADAQESPSPPWLTVSGEYRTRAEALGADDGYVLSRVRLGAAIDAIPAWRAVVQLQDARVFLTDSDAGRPPLRDVADVRLAYVEIGRREKSPVRLRIGRQELAFGEQRLIGTADWLNTGRTFDAARVTLTRPGVTLDGFGAYVVRVTPNRLNRPEPGTLLYGVDVALSHVPHATVEPYVFARRAPNQPLELGGRDALDSATIGSRWTIGTSNRYDVSGEIAGQIGAIGAERVRAWAGHWHAGIGFSTGGWKPRLVGEYNYASGDDSAQDGRRQTFDQLYPTGHDKYGLADRVGWKNIHHVLMALEARPTRRVTASVRAHSWWLATATDALYDAGGTVVVAAPGRGAARHVGTEADAQAAVTVSGHVRLGAGVAHVFADAVLRRVLDGGPSTYPYLSMNVAF